MSKRLWTSSTTVTKCDQYRLPSHNLQTSLRRYATTSNNNINDKPKLNYVLLPGRQLISVDGPNATDFLHNLLPAPILPIGDQPSCIRSAILNPKGRILHDIFIHKPSQKDGHRWLLEVDANSASTILKLLKKHKLRLKFKLEKLLPEEAAVFYLWPRSADPQGRDVYTQQDPRPGMGRRGFLIADNASEKLAEMFKQSDSEEYRWEDYLIHRMLNGHAEGPLEIISEHALPQESNLDFYGGIDFQKGCYLGQELTIRTHHTGVVRKRILPVQIYSNEHSLDTKQSKVKYDPVAALPQPPHEANIAKCNARGRSARSTGKWLGGYGNIGLALCRLETMTDLSLTAEGSAYNANDEFEVQWQDGQNVKVKAFVPPWLRTAIDDSIKARSERSQAKRKQIEEEDDEDVD